MAELNDPTTSSALMEGIITTAPNAAELGQPVDEYSCETLYIQNLNEKIKPEGGLRSFNDLGHTKTIPTVMKASLRGLFKVYGEVLDVVAHNNLRMRGQAFVSFASADIAKNAMKEVQRFPLYAKPMVFSFFFLLQFALSNLVTDF